MLLFGGLLIAYIVSLNRRLHLGLAQLEAASAGLTELSTTDALTGLFKRRHFDTAPDHVPLTARELIAGADAALYRAKREGRNRSILHAD